MARPLRLEFAGVLYHITSRGDGREAIFRAASNRVLFLDVLAGVWGRFNWVVHGYCLMTNHYYHVLVKKDGVRSCILYKTQDLTLFTLLWGW